MNLVPDTLDSKRSFRNQFLSSCIQVLSPGAFRNLSPLRLEMDKTWKVAHQRFCSFFWKKNWRMNPCTSVHLVLLEIAVQIETKSAGFWGLFVQIEEFSFPDKALFFDVAGYAELQQRNLVLYSCTTDAHITFFAWTQQKASQPIVPSCCHLWISIAVLLFHHLHDKGLRDNITHPFWMTDLWQSKESSFGHLHLLATLAQTSYCFWRPVTIAKHNTTSNKWKTPTRSSERQTNSLEPFLHWL